MERMNVLIVFQYDGIEERKAGKKYSAPSVPFTSIV